MKHRHDASDALAALYGLPRPELITRWQAMHGQPAPKGISRRLLEYAVAFDLQSKVFGGMKPGVLRKLKRMSDATAVSDNSSLAKGKTRKFSPGTRLMREWHGTSHTVDVLEDGFLYAGRHYRSLSEIARIITGARWSGPRFFGL